MSTQRRFEEILESIRAYHANVDVSLLERAYNYCTKMHAGQQRKSGEPYTIHPIEVAYLLTKLRLDEASVVTGLLHDTVEDTLVTLDDVKTRFGHEIAQLVDGVTKLSKLKFHTDEHKQAENFRKMLVAMAKDIRVVLVKLADRLHNMRTLHHLAPQKQVRIARETMEIYAPLANRCGIHWMKSDLETLSFQYLYPEEYEALLARVSRFKDQRDLYVKKVVLQLQEAMQEHHLTGDVAGRPKEMYSIYKKMVSKHIDFEQIYDIVAFRIVVDSIGACYEALGLVHAIWRPIPGRFKDYIAMPKPNQYQSLHTSVVGPDGERIEVQIRTHQMHRICEEGIAAHWEYTEGSTRDAKVKSQFAWLRQLMEWQQDVQDPNEFLDIVKYDLFVDEVFVFTPRGQVVSLKRGSTPVDFAFAIHTEVGTHCAGAKVNGRMVPLRHELKNGDMVEIITNPQQRPNRDWLKFVATSRARNKIRTLTRAEERARSRELGEQMLEREFKRHGLSLSKLQRSGALQGAAEQLHHGTPDGLYVAIGYGHTTAHKVLELLVPDAHLQEEEPSVLGQIFRKVTRRTSGVGVIVQGIDDVLVRYGKCCNPLPGDPIVGFVTRGRGITVHTANCPRAIDADPERRIAVEWDEHTTVARPVTVRVATEDLSGVLATISQTFTDNGINIAEANCKVSSEMGRALNTFEVLIKDADQLRVVLGKIRQLKGVLSVDRL